MRLFEQATTEQVADADDLVDPTLRRSNAEWDELALPLRTLDLVTRAYDTYGRLVGVPPEQQGEARAELDDLTAELAAYYDECFDVARNRTGAITRKEKRKAVRRVREEMRSLQAASDGRLSSLGRRAKAKLRGSS
jgi:hypothetical protein